MQISISTKSVFGWGKPRECINNLLKVGFKGLMLDLGNFYSSYRMENYGMMESDSDLEKVRELICDIIEECSESSMILDIIKAPRLRWDTQRTDLNALMLQVGKDSIRVCKEAKGKYVVIQPLFSGIEREDVWQENVRYYRELGEIAQRSGIGILLENQCIYKKQRFVRGICSNPRLASEWIDTLNKEFGAEVFGFCLDTGAGNICKQDIGGMAVSMGKRLKAVLVRENDSVRDVSRLAFMGKGDTGESTDWRGFIHGLRRMDFDGTLIMDASDTMRNLSHLLRPALYPIIRSVADYIGWQVEMEKRIKMYPQRVLFGAGNMCKNYMEYYGEKYPPLFICDNNSKLWGTRISNLEVKSPETLKGLPEGCAVIICNTFYEEISRQLKKMGVQSIEAFSDEYLF